MSHPVLGTIEPESPNGTLPLAGRDGEGVVAVTDILILSVQVRLGALALFVDDMAGGEAVEPQRLGRRIRAILGD